MRNLPLFLVLLFVLLLSIVIRRGSYNLTAFSLSNAFKHQVKTPSVKLVTSTTCDVAAIRGAGQKTVSFSFFEKDDEFKTRRIGKKFIENNVNRVFFDGLKTNLNLLPKFYPNWMIRIYHDIHEEDPLSEMFHEIAQIYNYVDFCNVRYVSNDILPGSFSDLLCEC